MERPAEDAQCSGAAGWAVTLRLKPHWKCERLTQRYQEYPSDLSFVQAYGHQSSDVSNLDS